MSEASPALGAPDTWVAPLARALPALVLGLVITFSQDHSARLGLTGFGVFAVVTGDDGQHRVGRRDVVALRRLGWRRGRLVDRVQLDGE